MTRFVKEEVEWDMKGTLSTRIYTTSMTFLTYTEQPFLAHYIKDNGHSRLLGTKTSSMPFLFEGLGTLESKK